MITMCFDSEVDVRPGETCEMIATGIPGGEKKGKWIVDRNINYSAFETVRWFCGSADATPSHDPIPFMNVLNNIPPVVLIGGVQYVMIVKNISDKPQRFRVGIESRV